MDIVELIAQTGGTLGLAVFAIWMLNRVWELRLEEAQRHADCERQRGDQVRQALDSNTKAMTRLIEIVERLAQG
jgi:hypothetical protein